MNANAAAHGRNDAPGLLSKLVNFTPPDDHPTKATEKEEKSAHIFFGLKHAKSTVNNGDFTTS